MPGGQKKALSGAKNLIGILAGQYFDEETGLHYNCFRYYAPKLGRYLRADPLWYDKGLNLYVYARNNAEKFKDSRGLFCTPWVPTFETVWIETDSPTSHLMERVWPTWAVLSLGEEIYSRTPITGIWEVIETYYLQEEIRLRRWVRMCCEVKFCTGFSCGDDETWRREGARWIEKTVSLETRRKDYSGQGRPIPDA